MGAGFREDSGLIKVSMASSAHLGLIDGQVGVKPSHMSSATFSSRCVK